GDRTGVATPGHVEAMKRAGGDFAPIFPQQSIREMERTGRSADVVMQDAVQATVAADWDGVVGADADHLKTPADVDVTVAAGFTFFTIDPSDYVDRQADDYSASELDERFAALDGGTAWFDDYRGKTVTLPGDIKIELEDAVCKKAAVKYGKAIAHAVSLGRYIADANAVAGRDHEIELSVDETDQPTTAAEHYIIADQCLSNGLKLVSLAPRFVGDFEKGVDFKGDIEAFRRSLEVHAAIAEHLGPYKLSLHSGSDKLSIYPAFARATRGRLHVKTAGTTYLEALRVVAQRDAAMFREFVTFARQRYDEERKTYHVSAAVADVPPPEALGDLEVEDAYLERWATVEDGKGFTAPGRQILHCTFGSTLKDPKLGPMLRDMLSTHADLFTELLAEHFERHLLALRSGIE
ncbi:MAG: tagaturonate epimerase family protein, partial [Planctomycetota bacterium]